MCPCAVPCLSVFSEEGGGVVRDVCLPERRRETGYFDGYPPTCLGTRRRGNKLPKVRPQVVRTTPPRGVDRSAKGSGRVGRPGGGGVETLTPLVCQARQVGPSEGGSGVPWTAPSSLVVSDLRSPDGPVPSRRPPLSRRTGSSPEVGGLTLEHPVFCEIWCTVFGLTPTGS